MRGAIDFPQPLHCVPEEVGAPGEETDGGFCQRRFGGLGYAKGTGLHGRLPWGFGGSLSRRGPITIVQSIKMSVAG